MVIQFQEMNFEAALLVVCLAHHGNTGEIERLLPSLTANLTTAEGKEILESVLLHLPTSSIRDVAISALIREQQLPIWLTSATHREIWNLLRSDSWLVDLPVMRNQFVEHMERTKDTTSESDDESIATEILIALKQYSAATERLLDKSKREISAKKAQQDKLLIREWQLLASRLPIAEQIQLMGRMLRAPSGSEEQIVFCALLGTSQHRIDDPRNLCDTNPFSREDYSYSVPLVGYILAHKELQSEVRQMLEGAVPSDALPLPTIILGSVISHGVGASESEGQWLAILRSKLTDLERVLDQHGAVMSIATMLAKDLLGTNNHHELGKDILEAISTSYQKRGALIAWVQCELLLISNAIAGGNEFDALARLDSLFRVDLSHGTLLARQIGSKGNLSFYRVMYQLQIAKWAAEQGFSQLSRRYATEAMSNGLPLPDLEEKNDRSRQYYEAAVNGSSIRNEIVGELRLIDTHWRSSNVNATEVFDFWLELVVPTNTPQKLNTLETGDTRGNRRNRNQQVLPFGLNSVAMWTKRASRHDALRSRIADRGNIPANRIAAAVIEYELSDSVQQRESRFVELLTQIESWDEERRESSQSGLPWLLPYLSQEMKTYPELETLLLSAAIAPPKPGDKSKGMFLSWQAITDQVVGSSDEMLALWKRTSVATVASITDRYQVDPLRSNRMAAIAETIPKMKLPKSELDVQQIVLGESLIDVLLDMEPEESYSVAGAICKTHPKLAVNLVVQKQNWNLPKWRLNQLSQHRPVAHILLQKDIQVVTVWDVWFAAAQSLQRSNALSEQMERIPFEPQCKIWVQLLRQRFEQSSVNFNALMPTQSEGDQSANAGFFRRWSDDQEQVRLVDLEMIYQALKDPQFRDIGKAQLGRKLQVDGSNEDVWYSQMQTSLAKRKLPKHWIELLDAEHLDSVREPSWSSVDRTLSHSGSPWPAILYRYPLGGTFEVTGKTIDSTAVRVGFSMQGGNRTTGSRPIYRNTDSRSRWSFSLNDQTIKLGGDRRFSSFAQQAEDSFPFPWFAIGDDKIGLRFTSETGRPIALSEVPLICPSMAGWLALGKNESVSDDLYPLIETTASISSRKNSTGWQILPADLDTNVAELIHPREVHKATGNIDPQIATGRAEYSILRYQRPMQPGDRIDYEFYVDDSTNVEPMIGNQIYQITQTGVQVKHIVSKPPVWMNGCLDWSTEPDGQVLGKLPSEQSGWRRASLKMEKDSILISIDGVEIYRGPVANPSTAFFGLYHESSKTQVRVRNMKLTGDWPKELPSDWLE